MAPRAKKRKSEEIEDERTVSIEKCKRCTSMVPACQSTLCSMQKHYGCVNCLRTIAEQIAFDESDAYDADQQGLKCFRNRCQGVYPLSEFREHLIPEIANVLQAMMSTFSCGVCFMDQVLKDGLSCRRIDQQGEDSELHTFCVECVKGYAGTEDLSLATGGIGISCMHPNCENALMLSEVRHHLPADIIKRIEERVTEESLGHAQIEGLERCTKCNYAVEVLEGRYFICVCGHKQCRTCGETFDTPHSTRPCFKKKNQEDLNIEEQINNIVVRFCHKCNVRFVKSTGCNFMKCRCGSTQCYICRSTDIGYDHFCTCVGFESECKCGKRCRQFADSNHIDSHRIELLKQKQATKGENAVVDNDILSAMPAIQIEHDSDNDDDDDGEDDFFNDSDDDDFFENRRVEESSDEEELFQALPVIAAAQVIAPSSDDEDDSDAVDASSESESSSSDEPPSSGDESAPAIESEDDEFNTAPESSENNMAVDEVDNDSSETESSSDDSDSSEDGPAMHANLASADLDSSSDDPDYSEDDDDSSDY